MDRPAIETRLQEFFTANDHGVVAAYLFGSLARDSSTPHSDVDVAVLLHRNPPPTLEGLCLDLAAAMEQHIGHSVDLVVLNTAPVDLIHRVLRDGRLIIDRDRSARIRFEVQARNEFFDLQPILTRYRAARGVAR